MENGTTELDIQVRHALELHRRCMQNELETNRRRMEDELETKKHRRRTENADMTEEAMGRESTEEESGEPGNLTTSVSNDEKIYEDDDVDDYDEAADDDYD
jgi:hypothetical protein